MTKAVLGKKVRAVIGTVAVCSLAIAMAWSPSIADPPVKSISKHVPAAVTRSSKDPLVPARGKLGQDLFMAVGRGDIAAVKSLLKRGADPNARNSLEFVPLFIAAASGQSNVMDTLLQSGAKLEASSPYGTALVQAALAGNTPSIRYLLSKGADIKVVRPDGITLLMLVSRSGDPAIVREFVRRKADVNAKDNDGATPLIYAAREGHLEVGRTLVRSGAAVNSTDSHRWTPLMYAAVNGHAEFVRLLLENGAKPNTLDMKGRTALLLAATYGGHPEVIRALLQGGADAKVIDPLGHTAAVVAAARGNNETAAMLGYIAVAPVDSAVTRTRVPKDAVQSSLKVLASSMLNFNKRTGCISCHQDGLGRIVTGAAHERGFELDPAVEQAQQARINGAVNSLSPLHLKALKDPEAMKQVPLIEIDEVSTTDTWLLAGMEAHKQPVTDAIGAMTMVLARQQHPEGSWQFILPRVPMQSSNFTYTALAIRCLRAYGPEAYSAEVSERINRARNWLKTSATQTNEDRAFRLLGLKWAGASSEEIRKCVTELSASQRKDGGWSQLTELQSDAYATGQALYALHVAADIPVTDQIYQRGVQFLMRTQDEDGSWFVRKRAVPANNYFNAGFPHGQSQYSSFNGTCWATMALLETIDRPAQTTVSER